MSSVAKTAMVLVAVACAAVRPQRGSATSNVLLAAVESVLPLSGGVVVIAESRGPALNASFFADHSPSAELIAAYNAANAAEAPLPPIRHAKVLVLGPAEYEQRVGRTSAGTLELKGEGPVTVISVSMPGFVSRDAALVHVSVGRGLLDAWTEALYFERQPGEWRLVWRQLLTIS